jgi:hypothetical protein
VGISGHLELVSQFVLALENPEEKELDYHGSADMVDAMEGAQRSHISEYCSLPRSVTRLHHRGS